MGAILEDVAVWLPLSPGGVLLMLLVAVATLPAAVDGAWSARGRESDTTSSPPHASVVGPPETAATLTAQRIAQRLDEATEAMSDAELCRAWRRSFLSLREARSPVERLAVVLQRQSFLDAFEARREGAFQQWLASGAAASAGPDTFLIGHADQTYGPHERWS